MSAPVKTFDVGNVHVSVFENKNDKFTKKSFCVQKSYLDKDKKWQHNNYFDQGDLVKLMIALQQAIQWAYQGNNEVEDVKTDGVPF